MDTSSIDFAVAAWREEGRWSATALPKRSAASLEALSAALRQFPGEGGVMCFVGVGDEFLLIVRQVGEQVRALISDGPAVLDWDIADEAAEAAGIVVDEEELEDFVPLGDVGILADFGFAATDLELLCEDDSLFPDDQLRAIAKRLGFAPAVATALKAR